ncbi:MAG: polymerase subunit alpha [Burkholderiales bacterium]|jgi:DNA polymerase-3 subunit epsilon|nr:polymerase subunit alpha [Burkholderiales bacterium]
MFNKPIVMLDFETTGLSPDFGARVTEVAAVRINGNKIVDRFVSLINCNVRIPGFITEITGITQQMVDAAPCPSIVMPRLMQFIGTDILAAHNACFDAKFLLSENRRLGLKPHSKDLLCSLMLSRRIFPGLSSYKLTNLSRSFGINFKSRAHRAEADAEVAANLLIHIGQHVRTSYNLMSFDPHIFNEINKISAAKVTRFLQNKFVANAKDSPE